MGLASTLAMALDPAVFSVVAGIEPDPWQADVLRSSAPRILLNCCRQSGKSTTVATLAAHTAIYQPGSLVLIVSPTQRQSAELLRKVADALGAGGPVGMEAESVLSLETAAGSRVVALPGKESTVRGYSADLLLIDEAAYVADPLYSAVRPTLALRQGRLIALSTPWARRGWWADAWHSSEAWERKEVTVYQVPRIPEAFIEEERRNLGPLLFASQYECTFVDPKGAAFRSEEVDRAFSKEYEPWSETWNLSSALHPSSERRYP